MNSHLLFLFTCSLVLTDEEREVCFFVKVVAHLVLFFELRDHLLKHWELVDGLPDEELTHEVVEDVGDEHKAVERDEKQHVLLVDQLLQGEAILEPKVCIIGLCARQDR